MHVVVLVFENNLEYVHSIVVKNGDCLYAIIFCRYYNFTRILCSKYFSEYF